MKQSSAWTNLEYGGYWMWWSMKASSANNRPKQMSLFKSKTTNKQKKTMGPARQSNKFLNLNDEKQCLTNKYLEYNSFDFYVRCASRACSRTDTHTWPLCWVGACEPQKHLTSKERMKEGKITVGVRTQIGVKFSIHFDLKLFFFHFECKLLKIVLKM